MSEITIMNLITKYRNSELKDTVDLLNQIYEICEHSVEVQEDEYWDKQAENYFEDEVQEMPDDEIGFNPYMGCYDYDC